MRAGALDRVVAIEARIDGAPNAAGTSSPTWLPFATRRAQLVQGSSDEFLASYGEGTAALAIFRLRYLDGLTTKHRLTFEGTAYNIREIKQIGRREGLELRCEVVR